MMKIGYIGFSLNMLRELLGKKYFHVACCICEDKRITIPLKEECGIHSIVLVGISNKEELLNAIHQFEIDKYVMYEFGLIVPVEMIGNRNIVNFHPGSLENNRGRSPIVQSILRGDWYSKMVVYRIQDKIDQGKEICSKVVKIEENETSKTLKYKLEVCIPGLLDAVYQYWKFGMCVLHEGIYASKVSTRDYTVDLNSDSPESAARKIRSQALYSGGIIDGVQICHLEYTNYHWEKIYESDDTIGYLVMTKVEMKKSGK